jgi:putative ABC transport system substrate-binding protein
VRRREFISFLGSTLIAWPLALSAQQPALPVLGFLNRGSPNGFVRAVAGLQRDLSETGYVEGQSLAIEYRWAEGRYERLSAMATELVRRPVDVLVATGGTPSVRAAPEATTTIPIVISTSDPVGQGLITSLNRPGGNSTGVNLLTGELLAKGLQLVSELVSNATDIAILVNPANQEMAKNLQDAELAAHALGRRLQIVNASTPGEIESALATLDMLHVGALLVGNEPFFFIQRNKIVALAAPHVVPAINGASSLKPAG